MSTVTSLTPTPLTAVGPGPWVLCPRDAAWAQIELPADATGSATAELQACITPGKSAPASFMPLDPITGPLASSGTTIFSRPIYVRLNVLAISNPGSGLTGAISGN